MKNITLATVKSFIRKNDGKIYIKTISDFDSMQDCVAPVVSNFKLCTPSETMNDNNLGLSGAWFVGRSGDYFSAFEDNNFTGIEIYNCCGCFILAIKK